MSEGISFSVHLTMALIGATIGGAVGFGLGCAIGTMMGVALLFPCAFLGLLCGWFFFEISFAIRWWLGS